MSNKSLHLKQEELKPYLKEHNRDLILIDFYADWCPHCQIVGPLLEKLAQEFHEQVTVIKIDTEQAEHLAQEYQVEYLPTIIVYRGQPLERTTGSNTYEFYSSLIKKYLSPQ
jgi:thioredoxin